MLRNLNDKSNYIGNFFSYPPANTASIPIQVKKAGSYKSAFFRAVRQAKYCWVELKNPIQARQ
jgi:hypothetical protein